ncbi:MAG: hypothetical protein KF708_20480 [Pirellulales bacterium]|nr:hypothetical protein [Pirellulales bacterium]
MAQGVLIAADVGDFIVAAAAILIPLAYVIRTIIAARRGNKPPAGAPQRPAPRRVAPPQQGQGAHEQKKLTDEVEEFLRRAAERRRGGQPREVEIVRPEPRQPPRSRPRPKPVAQRPVVLTDEERIGREPVAQHVEQHLSTTAYEERAAHLAKVDDADELMQAHLSSVFDHQVGQLGSTSAPAAGGTSEAAATETSPTALDGLAELLRSPAGLRQAFILQEVLRRPEERW